METTFEQYKKMATAPPRLPPQKTEPFLHYEKTNFVPLQDGWRQYAKNENFMANNLPPQTKVAITVAPAPHNSIKHETLVEPSKGARKLNESNIIVKNVV
jgi:hypothetical protein